MSAMIVIERVGQTVVSCSRGQLNVEDVARLERSFDTAETHFYLAGASGDVELDPASRIRLYDLLRKKGIKVTAVTDSKTVKGIVTAASWMGVAVRGCSWQDVERAAAGDDKETALESRSVDILLRQRRLCETRPAMA